MSEVEMNCMEARETLTLVRDVAGVSTGGDAQMEGRAQAHLKDCKGCNVWSQQVGEIVAMASSMPQFDVSEALTQNIMKAVDSEPAHQTSVLSGANLFQMLFGLAVVAIMMVEAAEDINGLVAWAIGLGVVYSINLLVRSNKEVDLLCD
ncbi:MAG: hypothetical protein C0507_15625 [Cyanobacteria bacterium PR.3.49]|nr:hypothetical protein [Cyanobacteria bacterium PR.3.49]